MARAHQLVTGAIAAPGRAWQEEMTHIHLVLARRELEHRALL